MNLNVRVHPEELAKLHALADDRDLSASTLVRHMVREVYAARFGNAAPPDKGVGVATAPALARQSRS